LSTRSRCALGTVVISRHLARDLACGQVAEKARGTTGQDVTHVDDREVG
jgi:hypothetical protein